MELRTDAADRVLEALAPALAAEIERIVEETRRNAEAEFDRRLETAVRDAEASTRIAAEAEQQQAIDQAIRETQQTVRSQVTADLQAQFEQRLQETSDAVRTQVTAELMAHAADQQSQFQTAQAEWAAERDRLQAQLNDWRIFADAQRQLAEATSQPEILLRWLNLAEGFASSVALYTGKEDGLALWKSRGKAVFPPVVSQQTTDPESYFRPIVIRGKTVAAVSAIQPYRAEALDFLSTTLERAIEFFGLRLRHK